MLHVNIFEPSDENQRLFWAQHLREVLNSNPSFNSSNLIGTIQQLNATREFTIRNLDSLGNNFRQKVIRNLNSNSSSVIFATNVSEAVAAISQWSGKTRVIATTKSTVINEMIPGLKKQGYSFIDTYKLQFKDKKYQNRFEHQWQIEQGISEFNLHSFNYVEVLIGNENPGEFKDVIALLGVNAAAADDGSIFFLQHTNNIAELIVQAQKIVIVIALDKIVTNRLQAIHQVNSAGLLGWESMLLDLNRSQSDPGTMVIEPLKISGVSQEVYAILLDNGPTLLREFIATCSNVSPVVLAPNSVQDTGICPNSPSIQENFYGHPS